MKQGLWFKRMSSLAVLAAALAFGSAAAQAEDPVVIGAAIAQSGGVAPYDEGPAGGMEIAIDEINAKGGLLGHPLKVVYADTKSDIAYGATAAQQVIDEGAKMVVVTCDYDFGSAAASHSSKPQYTPHKPASVEASAARIRKPVSPCDCKCRGLISGVLTKKFGRYESRAPVCVSSVMYSMKSRLDSRHVKYVYDCEKPILPSRFIMRGRVKASARKIVSG